MNQTDFQDPAWYQAIPLAERIASLRTTQHKTPPHQIDTALAERRLQRWRAQNPFTDDAVLNQRLEMDSLTEDEFRRLLGEPAESVKERTPTPPAWLTQLAEAFADPPSSEPLLLPEAFRDQKAAGFFNLVEPLIQQARRRLRDGIQTLVETYADLPFNPDTVERLLFLNLPGRLIFMLSRTLVLELNVARLQEQLRGETPEERFRHFVERLRQPEVALSILQEYPVLARQAVVWIDQWLNYSLEFLHHLCADWHVIRATFCPGGDPGSLTEVNAGAGDRHRDGRAVIIVRFSTDFRLVYKPKSLAVDVHFQELLAWLNARGDHPPFRTLKMLDRETHGWIEFAAAQGCTSQEQVRRFYQRQGGYLALLYALEATDFHYENLIAAGEHPVLVDLESLFHPRPSGMDTRQSEMLAGQAMIHSVLRIGLLPQRIWVNQESEGIEISGLGMLPGQLTPKGVPQWDDAGTDQMRFTRKRVEMPTGRNRPNLNGQDVNVLDYAGALADGFTMVYRMLLQHRQELLADDGPMARFAGDQVRAILRPTRIYGLLLQESFHPDMLRCALDRERLFDRLWVGIENQPYLSKIISVERQALWRNDVPMFTTSPASRHLWSEMGELVADFFDQPGLHFAHRRVEQLSEADLAQQLWFVRASLTALEMGEEQVHKPGRYFMVPSQSVEQYAPADRERLLAAACAVGDRLAALALHGEQDVSWLGLTLINERYWTLMPLGLDLYGGLLGVILFLAYLGAVSREEHYTTLAQRALEMLRRYLARTESFVPSIGGFSGWGGLIYTLAHLAVLWQQPDLLAAAESFVAQCQDQIEQDQVLDIIGGAAGCIGGLFSLYRCAPSGRTLGAAIRCGDHLLARAQPMPQGTGWPPAVSGSKPLAGFSHGTAGMAWALLELAGIAGQERFRAAALDALAYERSLFSPEMGNWPDLRDFETTTQEARDGPTSLRFIVAWCHGAPGIGLARLCALKHLDDDALRAEIDAAVQTTLATGFGGNHSLCHGALGNLELLLQASRTLNDSRLSDQVYRIAAAILESIDQHGWLCGVPLGAETPGLMVGLAGIGYELLRLADPGCVPSLLVLEPPILAV